MVKQIYPRLEINLQYFKENVAAMVEKCNECGIDIAGVIKGTTGIPQCAQMFKEGGAKIIASSRLEQIEDTIEFGVGLPTLLLRIPMLSEVDEVIRLCDISLNSEVATLKALNEAAAKQDKIHKVILMADVGDLREGFWDKDEMVEAAVFVENELKNLNLAGVGFNVGCWGSIEPMPENLNELVSIAERIEARIGRELEYISGGATSTLMRVIDGVVPERINLLRCGEGIFLARDLDIFYGYDMSYMHQDVFKLYAEVIEVRDKPTHPIGKIAIDCFGHKPVYEDRGIRRRALLGMGRVDYGSIEEIFPVDKGIEVIGAASDHTIIDVEEAERDLKVGDILEFDVNYASLVYLTASRNVQKVFI